MRIIAIVLFFVFSSVCEANSPIKKVSNPNEVRKETSLIPKELEGLQWNRWTSKNFVVCSIDDQQAQFLNKNLEYIKTWIYQRWGLPNVDFSAECKIICVHDPKLFQKLFNLTTTRVEIRRDETGKIKETVVFMLCDDTPSKIVPIPISEICFAELSNKFKMWSKVGMAQLNGTFPQIKDNILFLKNNLEKNEPMFFSKGLFEMTQENYNELDQEKKKLYDACAMTFCLMVRKELGQKKFLELMQSNDIKTLGFKDENHIDRTIRRYMIDMIREARENKIPNNYLQITSSS